jgi:tetratricopeptide (TPR) repeat protein
LGPTPAPEALRKVEQVRDRVSGHRKLEVAVGRSVAYLRAMQGDFDGARSTIDNARSIAEEIGEVTSAGVLLEAGRIELLAGDVDTAVKVIRASLAILDRIGDRGHSVTVAGQLADALLLQGETAEAASNIDFVIRWSMDEDLDPQIARRRVQGRLLALEGRFDEAERLAREAVELADRTDYLVDRAATLDDLGEVLGLAGRTDEAAECLGRALELHEQKGNVAGAARTQARLGLLQATAP